jgi:hypothetical protein
MYKSENKTKWMALAVLCPLPVRQHYLDRRAAGEMTDSYELALELRIPEICIPTVLSDDFPAVVGFLLEESLSPDPTD